MKKVAKCVVLTVAVLLAVSPAMAIVEIQHSGNADPTTEGWTLNDYQGGGLVGAIGGPPAAWKVSDVGTAVGYYCNYSSNAMSDQKVADASAYGWTMRLELRNPGLDEAGSVDAVDLGVQSTYHDGVDRWAVRVGFDGTNPVVDLGVGGAGGSYTVTSGDATTTHLYELVYDPITATAGLFVDGASAIAGFSGDALANINKGKIVFGNNGSSGVGYYKTVELDAVPEPATICVMAVGGLLVARRRRQKR